MVVTILKESLGIYNKNITLKDSCSSICAVTKYSNLWTRDEMVVSWFDDCLNIEIGRSLVVMIQQTKFMTELID